MDDHPSSEFGVRLKLETGSKKTDNVSDVALLAGTSSAGSPLWIKNPCEKSGLHARRGTHTRAGDWRQQRHLRRD